MYSRSLDLTRYLAVSCCLLASLGNCTRERRELRPAPALTGIVGDMAGHSAIHPGGDTAHQNVTSPYQSNAYAISEGQRLFNWYNCSGCHANGGGGMGPPLMDDEWIYGSEPENIAATILEGRPNGMPSFRGRVSTPQVWQLVAYVRSMSGLTPKDARPGRTDHMQYKQQEQSKKPEDAKRALEAPPASVTP